MVDRRQGATGSKRLTSDALVSDPDPAGVHCYDANTSQKRVGLGTVSHFRRCRLTRLRQSVPCMGTVSENSLIYGRSGLELLK